MKDLTQVLYGSPDRPLRIGKIALQCYLLPEETVLFDLQSLPSAFGYEGKSKDWLIDLLASINKFYPVEGVLFDALQMPAIFTDPASQRTMAGIAAPYVKEISSVIEQAKQLGYLNASQIRYARNAKAISDFFTQNDIQQAVIDSTGYQLLKDAGKEAVRKLMIDEFQDETYQWVPALRDELFNGIFDLNGLDWTQRRNYREMAALLEEVIFSRLDDLLIEKLRTQKPKRIYRRKGFPPQELEIQGLREFISEVVALLHAAQEQWEIFLMLLSRSYPKHRNRNFAETPQSTSATPLDATLRQSLDVRQPYHFRRK